MSIMMYMLRHMRQPSMTLRQVAASDVTARQSSSKEEKKESPRLAAFRKMLREKTPIDKLDQQVTGVDPRIQENTLPPFPNNTNPVTGEIGGPRGPEPTRYGDWERNGKVSDF